MRKSRAKVSIATLAGVCMIGAGLTGFASTDAPEVNAVDAVAAIQDVAPQAVAGATAGGSSADAAVKASTADGLKVQVPVDAADGVQATLPDGGVSISLPFADQATDATASQLPGVVVYDNNNGSSTVPVVRADATVQINTVIKNASAPKRYDYPVTAPEGQSLQLAPDGSAFVGRIEGQSAMVSAAFAAPWAKDANGNAVATHYEVSGNTLTQVVDFTPSTAFPVVADPSVTFGTYIVVTMSQATAQAINAGSAGTAIALLALTGPIGGVIGAAVYSTIGGYNATRLSQCRNWAFSYTYLGQLVKASCA